MTLEGKVAIVTASAGAGIGRETVKLLAQEGADVVVSDIHERRTNALAEEIRDTTGRKALAITCNVRNTREINELAAKTLDEYGRIDILVNNAGINKLSPVHEMDDDTWDLVMDINLNGTFRCCRAVLPAMREQGSGAIVNLSSVAGWLGDANESHYSAAKAAIQAFTKSLAKESAPKGIRVNAIAPGLIYNEFLARIYPKESLDNIIEQTPVGRVGKPADIANTVLFLVSNKGSFVTGETFCISGGLYMR